MEDGEPSVFWCSDVKSFLSNFASDEVQRKGYYFRIIKQVSPRKKNLAMSATASQAPLFWLSIGRKEFGEIIFPQPLKVEVVLSGSKVSIITLKMLTKFASRSKFVLTDTALSVISSVIDRPAIVMVSKKTIFSSAACLSSNDKKWLPFTCSEGNDYFWLPHFSRYKILHCIKSVPSAKQSAQIAATDNENRMFFLQNSVPYTTAYNIPLCLHLTMFDKLPLTTVSVSHLVAKMFHENAKLRTVYRLTTDGLVASDLPMSAFQNVCNVAILPAISLQSKVIEMANYFQSVVKISFDLSSSVFSSHILPVGPSEVLLVLLFHHIAVDGLAIQALVQQLQGVAKQNTMELFPKTSEADFIQDWTKHLSGIAYSPTFPALNCKEVEKCGYVHVEVGDREFIRSLKHLAQLMEVSISSIISLSFGLALCLVLQCNKVLLGYVKTGRTSSESQNHIGFLAETLPVSVEITPQLPFRLLLRSMHQKLLLVYDSSVKLRDLIPLMNVPEGRHGKDLFSFLVVYQDIFESMPNEIAVGNMKASCKPWFADTLHAQTELSLEIIPQSNILTCRYQYQQQRLDQELVTYIHCLTTEIMLGAITSPNFCIDSWMMWLNCQLCTDSSLFSKELNASAKELCLSKRILVKMPLPPVVTEMICMYSNQLNVLPCVIYSIALSIVLSTYVEDSTVTLTIARQCSSSAGISMHPVFFDVSRSLTIEQAMILFQEGLDKAIHAYVPYSLCGTTHQAVLVDSVDNSSDYQIPTPILLQLHSKSIEWTFNSTRYDPVCIANHYLSCLMHILSNTSGLLQRVPLCTDTEEHFLLTELNDTSEPYNEMETAMDCLLYSLFLHKYNIAFVHVDEYLTYSELYVRITDAICNLTNAGVTGNSRIGIYMSRCLDFFVYMIAVMYMGAVYIPLPDHSPAKRLSQICSNANIEILVTCTEMLDILEQCVYSSRLLCTDTLQSCYSPINIVHPNAHVDNVAFIIHTSGTTGSPKGVCVSHMNLRNLLLVSRQLFTEGDLTFTRVAINVSFDPHLLELFPTLVAGGCCIVADNITCQHPAATCHVSTPSAASVSPPTKDVRVVIVGGEALSSSQYSLLQHVPKVVNAYGPSECTVLCTANVHIDDEDTSNIGSPMANVKLFVLNKQFQLCPLGTSGTLFVAGHCVSIGYLNDPEKTDQVFSQSLQGSGRMCCTGDEVRMSQSGTPKYLGRYDSQVKLRGFRLELGEVESALRSMYSIKEAAAVVKTMSGGSKQIIAFVTPADACLTGIEAKLADILPSYMVPYMIIPLDSFPLTKQGKLNRSFLLNEELPMKADTSSNISSENSEELRIVKEIFASLLKLDFVSSNDNFYKLGGDSLLAVQLANLISEKIHAKIHPSVVLNAPTPIQLASKIDASSSLNTMKYEEQVLPDIPLTEECKAELLTPRNWMVYLLEKLKYTSRAYTMKFSFLLAGRIDSKRVIEAGEAVLSGLGLKYALVCETGKCPYLILDSHGKTYPSNLVKPCCTLSLSSTSCHDMQLDLVLHRLVCDSWGTETTKHVFKLFLSAYFPNIDSFGTYESPADYERAVPSLTNESGFNPYCVSWSTKFPMLDSETASKLLVTVILFMWKDLYTNLILHHLECTGQRKAYVLGNSSLLDSSRDKPIKDVFTQIVSQSAVECNGDVLLYSFPPPLGYDTADIEVTLHQTLPTFSEYSMCIGTIMGHGYVTFVLSCHVSIPPCRLLSPHDVVEYLSMAIVLFLKDPSVSLRTLEQSLSHSFPDITDQTNCEYSSTLNSILGTQRFDFEFLNAGAHIWDCKIHQSRLTEDNFNIIFEIQDTIRSRLNILVPLKTLLLSPSKALLQKSIACLFFLSQNNPQNVQVLCTKNDTTINIFCFSELTGYPWMYQNVARHSAYQMTFVRYSMSTLYEVSSLEDLVQSLVDQIMEIQPNGPYILMGYSFGALLAYVAASLLIKSGKIVRSVILLDGSPLIIPFLSQDLDFKWIWDPQLFFANLGVLAQCPSLLVPHPDVQLPQFLPWYPLSSCQISDLLTRITKPLKLASRHKIESLGHTSCLLIRPPRHSVFQSPDYGLNSLCNLSVYEIPQSDHYSLMGNDHANQISILLESFLGY